MMPNLAVGIALIKRWEQCRLLAYQPIAGDKWTIGYGATGPTITQGVRWSQEQADGDLQNRVNNLASQLVRLITIPVNDNQFGALLSLTYNIGIGAFTNSTLLRLFNGEDYQGASAQFLVWNKSQGHVVQGLVNRREDEQHVFDTPA
jgi:lysozyme